MSVSIIHEDITKIKCDAIVNSLGIDIDVPGGIYASILMKTDYQKLVSKIHEQNTNKIGSIFITDSYGLPAPKIIHLISPFYYNDYNMTAMENCIRNILNLCKKEKIYHVVFPRIGSGANGYPNERIQDMMLSMFSSFTELYPEYQIDISVFKPKENYFRNLLRNNVMNNSSSIERRPRGYSDDAMEEYFSSNNLMSNDEIRVYDQSFFEKGNNPKIIKDDECNRNIVKVDIFRVKSYWDYLDNYIQNKHGIGEPEKEKADLNRIKIFLKQHLDSVDSGNDRQMLRHFRKITENNSAPKKETVIKLALAVKMNLDEAEEFLKFSGYSLSDWFLFDIASKECFKKKFYSPSNITDTYSKYNIKDIFKKK